MARVDHRIEGDGRARGPDYRGTGLSRPTRDAAPESRLSWLGMPFAGGVQMTGGRARRRIIFGFLTLVLLLGVTACVPEDVQFMQNFAMDWAKTKGLDPNTPAGMLHIAEAAAVGTGDPQVDAAIDAGLVVKNIQKVDNTISLRTSCLG